MEIVGLIFGIIGILILFFFLGLIVKVVRLFGGVFFSVVGDGIGWNDRLHSETDCHLLYYSSGDRYVCDDINHHSIAEKFLWKFETFRKISDI